MRFMNKGGPLFLVWIGLSVCLTLGFYGCLGDDLVGVKPGTPAQPAQPAVLDAKGNIVTPAVPAVPATPATAIPIGQSPVGTAIGIAQGATAGTPIGPLVSIGGNIALALLGIFQGLRVRKLNGDKLDWEKGALATAQGVQAIVSNLDAAHQQTPVVPAGIADQIKKLIDQAHDDHSVPQKIQNALTPTT